MTPERARELIERSKRDDAIIVGSEVRELAAAYLDAVGPPGRAIRPIDGRVVIRPARTATETASGIALPGGDKAERDRGYVVAVADDVDVVEIGDFVVYGRAGGDVMTFDGEKLLVLEALDLLGVIETA